MSLDRREFLTSAASVAGLAGFVKVPVSGGPAPVNTMDAERVIELIKKYWGLDPDIEIQPDTPLGRVDGEIKELVYMKELFDELGFSHYVGGDQDRILPQGKDALLGIASYRHSMGDLEGARHYGRLAGSTTLGFCNRVTPQNLADMFNYEQA
jgi:hypothetical protein